MTFKEAWEDTLIRDVQPITETQTTREIFSKNKETIESISSEDIWNTFREDWESEGDYNNTHLDHLKENLLDITNDLENQISQHIQIGSKDDSSIIKKEKLMGKIKKQLEKIQELEERTPTEHMNFNDIYKNYQEEENNPMTINYRSKKNKQRKNTLLKSIEYYNDKLLATFQMPGKNWGKLEFASSFDSEKEFLRATNKDLNEKKYYKRLLKDMGIQIKSIEHQYKKLSQGA